MDYQEQLKQAIIESFGFEFDELYDSLKNNIIKTDLISSMILSLKVMVDKIDTDEEYWNILHFKMNSQIIRFILKMREIYKSDMLNTCKIESVDGETCELIITNDTISDNKTNEEVYKNYEKELSAFDFILILLSKYTKTTYLPSIINELLDLCEIPLKYYHCFTCTKYRYLQECIDCEPWKEVICIN